MPVVSSCDSVGRLVRDVRSATRETGQRVIAVDSPSDRTFSFLLVDDAGAETGWGWSITLTRVSRGAWDLDDPEEVSVLRKLFPRSKTREVLAEWLSHRIGLDETRGRVSGLV